LTQAVQLLSAESEAAKILAEVGDGATVAVGGYYDYRHPMALVRTLIASGAKDLTLVAPSGSIDVDILIGAGVVKRLIGGRVAFGLLGLAPNFRRAVENGSLEFLETDTLTLVRGFQAAARDVPFVLTRTLIGSELLRFYPGKVVDVDGEAFLQVLPIRPDVCLVHAQVGDRLGNLRVLSEGFDVEMVKASRLTIASVEEIVSYVEDSRGITVPKYSRNAVRAVVEIPYGAHPTSCVPYYVHDIRHLLTYLETVEGGDFNGYLDRFVLQDGGVNHFDYVERAVGMKGLKKLEYLAKRGEEVVTSGAAI